MMQATQFPQKPSETNESPKAVTTLRKLLAEYSALAETARRANDASGYKAWSAATERVATALMPFENARLSAVMTTPVDTSNRLTDFVLNIFEKAREPSKQIEHVPDAAPPEVIEAVAEPEPAKPEEPKPAEPEASPTPPSPPPDEAPAPPSWAAPRSLLEHPSMRGSWMRGSWRH
jgi:hypothetical protein